MVQKQHARVVALTLLMHQSVTVTTALNITNSLTMVLLSDSCSSSTVCHGLSCVQDLDNAKWIILIILQKDEQCKMSTF